MMDVQTARKHFDQLEALKIEDLGEALDKLENEIVTAEAFQEQVDAITEEDRAAIPDDEYFVAEVDLEEAMEKVETAFEEAIEAIEAARAKLSDAEIIINKAFGCDIEGDGDEEAEAA